MIKNAPRGSIALVVLLLAGQVQALNAQELSLEDQIDGVLSAWNNTQSPGAAVAYIEGGETVFSKAYGLASLEHRIGWTIDTVSDLGSVSKQFLGFAVAMLAEQGALVLDDDIRLYLPKLPDLGETITIKHLFHHTSGLREIYNTLYLVNRKPGDIIFQEDAQTLVQYQRQLQFMPGSKYLYNNTEYMLLADIVEVVTGQQFHQWMEENIFTPLGMQDTRIMYRQGQVIPRVASSYMREEDGQFVQRYDNSTLQGGGGIYSTVEDMTRWIANFSSHKVGTEKTIELLTESGYLNNGESLEYGLGIGVVESDGVMLWSHSGSSAGYRSYLAYLPQYDRGFIFLTNTPANGVPASELTRVLLGDVLEVPQAEAPTVVAGDAAELPLEDPAPYIGRYLSDELEAFYSIVLEGDQLILSHRWLGSYQMRYLGEDQFQLDGLGGPVTFVRNENDEIEKFILDNGRTIGVEFRRLD